MRPESSQGFYLHHLPRYALLSSALPGSRLLQLGGGGYSASWAAELGAQVTCGLAPSEVGEAARLWSSPRLHFEGVELPHLPFAARSFDHAFAFEVIHPGAGAELLIQELKRVVHPEGFILLTIPLTSRDDIQEIMGETNTPHQRESLAAVHTLLNQNFRHVQVLYQSPFLGYLMGTPEGGRTVNISSELMSGQVEAPLFATLLASDLEIVLEEDALVQVPFFHLVDRIQEGLRVFHRSLERKNSALLELRDELALLRRRGDRLSSGQMSETTAHPTLPDGDTRADGPPVDEHPAEGGDLNFTVSGDEMRLLLQGLQGTDISEELEALAEQTPGDHAPTPPQPVHSATTPDGDLIFQEDLAPFHLPGPVALSSELRDELRHLQLELISREGELSRMKAWRGLLEDTLVLAEQRIFRELDGLTRADVRRSITEVWEWVAEALSSVDLDHLPEPGEDTPLVSLTREWARLRAENEALPPLQQAHNHVLDELSQLKAQLAEREEREKANIPGATTPSLATQGAQSVEGVAPFLPEPSSSPQGEVHLNKGEATTGHEQNAPSGMDEEESPDHDSEDGPDTASTTLSLPPPPEATPPALSAGDKEGQEITGKIGISPPAALVEEYPRDVPSGWDVSANAIQLSLEGASEVTAEVHTTPAELMRLQQEVASLRSENAELRAEMVRRESRLEQAMRRADEGEEVDEWASQTTREINLSDLHGGGPVLKVGPPALTHTVEVQKMGDAETDSAGFPRQSLQELPAVEEETSPPRVPVDLRATQSELLGLRRVLARALAGVATSHEGLGPSDPSSYIPRVEPESLHDLVDSLGLLVERSTITLQQLSQRLDREKGEVRVARNRADVLEKDLADLKKQIAEQDSQPPAPTAVDEARLTQERERWETHAKTLEKELEARSSQVTRIQKELESRTQLTRTLQETMERQADDLQRAKQRLREVITHIDRLRPTAP